MAQLTLIANINHVLRSERESAAGYSTRTTSERDKPALADLYFAAYTREIVSDLKAAQDEIERTFDGEYGRLDLEASPIATYRRALVGSIMTVKEAPWDDTPPGPFIIEVMIHPNHRGRGLAAHIMATAAQRLASMGKKTVALRVMSDNQKALSLYRKLGFVAWNPHDLSDQQAVP